MMKQWSGHQQQQQTNKKSPYVTLSPPLFVVKVRPDKCFKLLHGMIEKLQRMSSLCSGNSFLFLLFPSLSFSLLLSPSLFHFHSFYLVFFCLINRICVGNGFFCGGNGGRKTTVRGLWYNRGDLSFLMYDCNLVSKMYKTKVLSSLEKKNRIYMGHFSFRLRLRLI